MEGVSEMRGEIGWLRVNIIALESLRVALFLNKERKDIGVKRKNEFTIFLVLNVLMSKYISTM